MLEVGAIVGGKLRIERILGEGGMGLVAVATHLQLDQEVAIKVVRDPVLGTDEVVERFLREARASARLRSDHVCKVSDVGQLDDGAPYLVMELLDGSDLARVIAASPLLVATAADYVLQACVAVAEAHALGIIHRDLKPANLFLTRRFDGTPLIKVLDFGIASAPELDPGSTTSILGSPGYMSPERLRAIPAVDARSDVWSLGVILYELVTGRLPFRGQTVEEMTVKIVTDPPEPLALDAPAFAAIVARCLEKDVALRYPSVAELAADLAPLAGEAGPRTAALVASIQHAPPRGARAGTAPIVPPAVLGPGSSTTMIARSVPTAPTPAMGIPPTPLPPEPLGRATTLQAATGAVAEVPTRRRRSFFAGLLVGAAAIIIGAATALYLASGDDPEPIAALAPPAPPLAPAAAPPIVMPPAPPSPTSSAASEPDAQALDEAHAALAHRNAERALTIAQNLSKLWPYHPVVINLGVTAACRLRRPQLARELFHRLTERHLDDHRQQANLRAQCAAAGVTL